MNRILRLMVAVLCATGCVWAQATHKSTPRPRTAPRPTHRVAVRHSLLNPASLNDKAPATYKAKFTTTKGDFIIEVTRAWAPVGADRFYNLVKYRFYDGAAFFRVLPGFMAQVGISADPKVSAVWERATIKDDPVAQSNGRGMVSFATAGPGTRTTQIFINYGDNAQLDGQGFSPFGKVVEGMDVVEKLYSGYGEGAPSGNGPDQGRIATEGKKYLASAFPQLDTIKTAVIEGAPTPAAHHATSAVHHTTTTHRTSTANKNAR